MIWDLSQPSWTAFRGGGVTDVLPTRPENIERVFAADLDGWRPLGDREPRRTDRFVPYSSISRICE